MIESFGTVKLIEAVAFVSVALGFGLWQYISVSREIARDKEKKRDEDSASQ